MADDLELERQLDRQIEYWEKAQQHVRSCVLGLEKCPRCYQILSELEADEVNHG